MQTTRSVSGSVRVRAQSAEQAQLLSALNRSGIQLYDVTYVDELTVDFTVLACDLTIATKIAKKRGEQLTRQSGSGFVFLLKRILGRPILVIGILIVVFMSFFLPSRILFVEVEGNCNVADRLIIEHASRAGIRFGAARSSVRSERIKNTLLGELPQLQWAGVNTRGCVAVITVTERDPQPNDIELTPISHVIASRDGVIQSVTVSSGTALCQVGQAVEKGQVLVSGYTDCGIAIKAQRAQAEIFAQTNRDLVAVTPVIRYQRGDILGREQRYRLIIGKKQINLWKDSGISDATCVKMYKESYLTLPGGFALPVGIGVESLTYYDIGDPETKVPSASAWLEEWVERYLLSHMVCGQIISRETNIIHRSEIQQLSTKYVCFEMIGSNRDEELISSYGKKH